MRTLLLAALLALPVSADTLDDAAAAWKQGDAPTAIRLLQTSLQTNPHNGKALTTLTYLYFQTGDYVNAQKYGEQLVQESPRDNGALILLGSIYLARNLLERTIEVADQTLAVNPANDEGYTLKAAAYLAQKKPALAIPLMITALDKVEKRGGSAPEMVVATNSLAIAYYENNERPKALQICDDAILRWPNGAQLYVTASKACRSLKQYEKAVQYAERGLKANPSYGRLYGSLSLAYARLGRKKEAEEAFSQLKQREPQMAPELRQDLDNPKSD